jgi:hypothetical protein
VTLDIIRICAYNTHMNTELTHDELHRILNYNKQTGVFTWLVDSGARKCAGLQAGSLSTMNRVYISIKRKKYLAHRLAWFYVHGVWPSAQIDHKDGDPTNNRLSNLREATNAQNQQNLRNPKGLNPYVGVHYVPRGSKWAARINGKHIGYAKTAERAHALYLKAKAELHTHAPL